MSKKVFLSARWEYLAMLNYTIDAAVLQPYLAPGTELDLWQGKAMISVVGFLFNNTRVAGIRWPFFTNFEEVNLRYYVKMQVGEEIRRGVGFISEIVPRALIAGMANTLYNEHYSSLQMKHSIDVKKDEVRATFNWKIGGVWESINITAVNTLQPIQRDSAEEFIFEHYYGFNKLNDKTTICYEIEHPAWQVMPVTSWQLNADISRLYGNAFVPYIGDAAPHSVFLARGSDVIVRKPVKIRMPE